MPRPQAYVLDQGGEVWTYAPIRGGANPVVALHNSAGSVMVSSGTATLDSVNTTLNGALSSGATTVTLTSDTGVVSGRQYRIGAADPTTAQAPWEMVHVLSSASNVATLSRPLRYDHATGVAFAGTRLSRTIASGSATTLFANGYALWSWDSMSEPIAAPFRTYVECVRTEIIPLCTLEDVAAWEARVHQWMPSQADPNELIERAFESVVLRLEPTTRVNTMWDSHAFVRPTALRVLLDLSIQNMAEEEIVARWRAMYEESIADLARVPTDVDEDGMVEANESATFQGRVERG